MPTRQLPGAGITGAVGNFTEVPGAGGALTTAGCIDPRTKSTAAAYASTQAHAAERSGVEKTASTASPMNLSTLPSWASSTSTMISSQTFRVTMTCLTGSRSKGEVNPRRQSEFFQRHVQAEPIESAPEHGLGLVDDPGRAIEVGARWQHPGAGRQMYLHPVFDGPDELPATALRMQDLKPRLLRQNAKMLQVILLQKALKSASMSVCRSAASSARSRPS